MYCDQLAMTRNISECNSSRSRVTILRFRNAARVMDVIVSENLRNFGMNDYSLAWHL